MVNSFITLGSANSWLGFTTYNGVVYANNGSSFGTINQTTGAFTILNSSFDGNLRMMSMGADRVMIASASATGRIFSTDNANGSHFTSLDGTDYFGVASDGTDIYATSESTKYLYKLSGLAGNSTRTLIDMGTANTHRGLMFFNGVLYLATATGLFSVNKTTGAKTLVATVSGLCDLANDGEFVYATAPGTGVYKINITTGVSELIFSSATAVYGITYCAGALYTGLFSGQIVKISTKFKLLESSPSTDWFGIAGDSTGLYAVNSAGIKSINVDTGVSENYINSTKSWRGLHTYNGRLYCAVYGNYMVSYDTTSWSSTTYSSGNWFGATTNTDTALTYACQYGGKIYRITGTVTAITSTNLNWTGITYLGGLIYGCVDGGKIYSITTGGVTTLLTSSISDVYNSIVSDGVTLYATVYGGRIYTIDKTTGARTELAGDITDRNWQALTYYNNAIYAVVNGGQIYKIPVTSKPNAPTISLVSGQYNNAQSITLSTNVTASIYYTTDGSTPTSGSTLYSSAFTIDAVSTLKAIAIAGGASSDITTNTYTWKCLTPALTWTPTGSTVEVDYLAETNSWSAILTNGLGYGIINLWKHPDGYLYYSDQTNTVYRSINGGSSWTNVGTIPGSQVCYDKDGKHFCASGITVYTSNTGYSGWTTLTTVTASITSLSCDPLQSQYIDIVSGGTTTYYATYDYVNLVRTYVDIYQNPSNKVIRYNGSIYSISYSLATKNMVVRKLESNVWNVIATSSRVPVGFNTSASCVGPTQGNILFVTSNAGIFAYDVGSNSCIHTYLPTSDVLDYGVIKVGNTFFYKTDYKIYSSTTKKKYYQSTQNVVIGGLTANSNAYYSVDYTAPTTLANSPLAVNGYGDVYVQVIDKKAGYTDSDIAYIIIPLMQTSMYASVGGAWKTINGTYVSSNNVWKPIVSMYKAVGGNWSKLY